jgi:hypothetical protein
MTVQYVDDTHQYHAFEDALGPLIPHMDFL